MEYLALVELVFNTPQLIRDRMFRLLYIVFAILKYQNNEMNTIMNVHYCTLLYIGLTSL